MEMLSNVLCCKCISIVESALNSRVFRRIVFPVKRKQTHNDCGIYVIEYIQQFLHTQNELQNLSAAESSLLDLEIDALAVRKEIHSYRESPKPSEE
ncbi:hypothetical protein GEMRC1_008916 [Eukaryota sp. GEM-RC1]